MVKSCGGIIVNGSGYLLVKHRPEKGGHWSFPKGHMEDGETEEETALREIKEEVGLDVEIVDGFKEEISYYDYVNNEDKTVVFFFCKTEEDSIVLEDDFDEYQWLSYPKARLMLTHENSRLVLKKAERFRRK